MIIKAGRYLELDCDGGKIVITGGKIYFNGQEIHGLAAASVNLDGAMAYINDGKAKAPPPAPPEPPPKDDKPASGDKPGAGFAGGDGAGGANPIESGLSKLMEGGQNAFAALNQLKSLADTAQALKNGDIGAIAGVAGGIAGGLVGGAGKGGSAAPDLGGPVGMGDGKPGNF